MSSNYTLYDQISKFYQGFISYYENPTSVNSKLEKNEYGKSFMDDNNSEPFLTIMGSISDYFTGRLPDVKVVENFNLDSYLGEWHEIARYLTVFEDSDIIKAKAIYGKQGDIVTVKNIGYHTDDSEEVIRGTASLTYPNTKIGKLGVSFFPPFSGNYWIIILDSEYKYSVVSSPDKKYLWILSRTEVMKDEDLSFILNKLGEMNYDTSKLFYCK